MLSPQNIEDISSDADFDDQKIQKRIEENNKIKSQYEENIKELEIQLQNLDSILQQKTSELLDLSSKNQGICSQFSQQRTELQVLESKIEYIDQKIKNQNYNDDQIENQIVQDSIYLKTLLNNKKQLISELSEKNMKLKPIANISNQLDALQQKREKIKQNLELLKQTHFGNIKSDYSQIYQKYKEKQNQLEQESLKKAQLLTQIKAIKQKIEVERINQNAININLRMRDKIYNHYSNLCKQQETMIKNLTIN